MDGENRRREIDKVKTRVEAKAKIYGALPSQFKTLMGSVAKQSVGNLFDLFQCPRMNKKLLYMKLYYEAVL